MSKNPNPSNATDNQITVNYKPNDLWYYSSSLTPTLTEDTCSLLKSKLPSNCYDSDAWNDNSYNCYASAVCDNIEIAKTLQTVQNNNQHLVQQEKDAQSVFLNSSYLTWNIGIGILGMISVMVLS